MLEPLADVALGGPGAVGQLGRRGRAVVGERPVQAQAFAEVDRVQLERATRVAEEPIGQCGGPVVRRTHGGIVRRSAVADAGVEAALTRMGR